MVQIVGIHLVEFPWGKVGSCPHRLSQSQVAWGRNFQLGKRENICFCPNFRREFKAKNTLSEKFFHLFQNSMVKSLGKCV